MKKIILFSLFSFLSLIQSNKTFGQIVDGIVLIPFNLQMAFSSYDGEVFSDNKNGFGVSSQPQINFQKELKPDITIFTGIGYSYNNESVLISKNIKLFSELTGLNWANFQGNDSFLTVKKLRYVDEYLTIPFGIRFYSNPREERKFKLTLSTKIEGAFLLNSKVDVDLFKSVSNGFSFNFNNEAEVYNTIYERDAEQYFDDRTKKFLLNLQFGIGYETKIGKKFSFGTEFILSTFLMKHKPDFSGRKVLFGAQIRLGYDF